MHNMRARAILPMRLRCLLFGDGGEVLLELEGLKKLYLFLDFGLYIWRLNKY